MNKFLIFTALVILCRPAFAVDVTIQVNGGVLAQSCNVSSQDLIKNINFPDLNPADFSYAGATSAEQSFSVNLINCTGSVSNLTYKFSGDADNSDSTLLKIVGKGGAQGDGLATGLAIEILDSAKKRIDLNAVQALNTTITSATYTLNFFLRYKSTETKVGPGDASSIMYLDMYYE